jgi:hypothetical protein
MNTAKRRTLFFGLLLLLLPTLAAALGAGWLLHREQQRINTQAHETAETCAAWPAAAADTSLL